MLLLGIDLETTICGSKNEKTVIVEVGAVLYDWNSKQPVEILSALIKPYESDFRLDSFITKLTGITRKMLKSHGKNIKSVLKDLVKMAKKADYLVGHNGRLFDKKIILQECKKFNIDFPEKIMIDTLKDIDYPKTVKYKNLTYLAGFHHIIAGGHRALFDVFTMLEVLKKYDLNRAIYNTGNVKLKVITANPKQDRKEAIKHGFKWDRKREYWHRKYTRREWETISKTISFEVIVED